ncbi:MAG: acetoin utilization protein AcuC [Thermodesulfobacteriota bacterium]
MKTAFIYSDKFGAFSYGPSHPMRPVRLRLTYELISALGLKDLPGAKFIEARRASDAEILLIHTPEYLEALKEADSGAAPPEGAVFGLGYGDNPVFEGVFEWSSYSAGASLQAAELVAGGGADIAFNMAGGLHHAMAARASGFCYINDAALAVKYLVDLGRRVAYVDVDAHHGDGVERAFYGTDRVLTLSIHESGRTLFPGTGSVSETGEGAGEGFSVNLPLPPATGDGIYLRAFEALVPDVIKTFSPDVLVTQLGVDTFASDPITHLDLTTNVFEKVIKNFRSFGLPWVALGGGGYDLSNVSRSWTLAWAIMNGIDAPEKIPEEFLSGHGNIFGSPALRDGPGKTPEMGEGAWAEIEKEIDFIRENILPVIKARR